MRAQGPHQTPRWGGEGRLRRAPTWRPLESHLGRCPPSTSQQVSLRAQPHQGRSGYRTLFWSQGTRAEGWPSRPDRTWQAATPSPGEHAGHVAVWPPPRPLGWPCAGLRPPAVVVPLPPQGCSGPTWASCREPEPKESPAAPAGSTAPQAWDLAPRAARPLGQGHTHRVLAFVGLGGGAGLRLLELLGHIVIADGVQAAVSV